MEYIFDSLDLLNQFLVNGIPESIDNFFQRMGAYLVLFYFELKLSSIQFAWSIASGILNTLSLSSTLTASLNTISPDVVSFLNHLRLIEAFNIILSAHATKFVLSLF